MLGFIHGLLRRLGPQDGGNILIEFALAVPVLCILLAGGFDLGRYALQKSAIVEGARAGAQYGVFNSSDTANINTTAQNATGLSGVTASNSVFCECTAGTTVACTSTCTTLKKYITVNTTKPYSSVVASSTINMGVFGSWTPPTSMSASVTMLVAQ